MTGKEVLEVKTRFGKQFEDSGREATASPRLFERTGREKFLFDSQVSLISKPYILSQALGTNQKYKITSSSDEILIRMDALTLCEE